MTMLWSDARGLQVPDPSAPIDHNDVVGVSLYTYMYVTFIYVYILIYMRAYIHARIPIDYNYVAGVSLHHVYIHICVHIYACIPTCMYVCMHIDHNDVAGDFFFMHICFDIYQYA